VDLVEVPPRKYEYSFSPGEARRHLKVAVTSLDEREREREIPQSFLVFLEEFSADFGVQRNDQSANMERYQLSYQLLCSRVYMQLIHACAILRTYARIYCIRMSAIEI